MSYSGLILAGTLIDGTGREMKNQALRFEEGRIAGIQQIDEKMLMEKNVYDFRDKTVMPGLINAHVHCDDPVGLDKGVANELTVMEKAFHAAKNLQDYLSSGVTYIRSLGSENYYDMQLKKAVESGLIEGPHMLCAGRVICMTGGHGWTNGLESDGVDECRKNARLLLREGVDIVKIMATGGVMTKGVEPGSAQLTEEEMRAAVEEAHKANRLTATHAQGTEGIKNALRAGIDSIEHGIFLDQECIDLMKKQGTWLVPTLVAPQCIVEAGLEKGLADYVVRKANYVKDAHVDSFIRAYKQGVKIAMGTDAGTPFNYHNNSAYELELMVKYGVTEMDALVISTRNSAECLGVLNDHGTLEAGKVADVLVLDANPLEDISNIRKVNAVFKAGKQVI